MSSRIGTFFQLKNLPKISTLLTLILLFVVLLILGAIEFKTKLQNLKIRPAQGMPYRMPNFRDNYWPQISIAGLDSAIILALVRLQLFEHFRAISQQHWINTVNLPIASDSQTNLKSVGALCAHAIINRSTICYTISSTICSTICSRLCGSWTENEIIFLMPLCAAVSESVDCGTFDSPIETSLFKDYWRKKFWSNLNLTTKRVRFFWPLL